MFPLLREQPVLLAAKKIACGALSVVSFFKRREFPDPLRCRSEISTMDEVGMTETQINVLSTCFDVDFWGRGATLEDAIGTNRHSENRTRHP